MRNYVQLYLQEFELWDNTDPMNPILFGSHGEVSMDKDAAKAFAETYVAGSTTAETRVPVDGGSDLFVLTTKASLREIMNNPNPLNHALIESTSPRYGIDGTKDKPNYANWPSNDGDPRNPTAEVNKKKPGAGGYIVFKTLLAELGAIYGELVDHGLKRIADQYVAPVILKAYANTVTQGDIDILFAVLRKFAI
jgi:hypothetical protein